MSPGQSASYLYQWPTRRPRWVGLIVWGLGVAALSSLVYVCLHAACVVLALYGLQRLRRRARGEVPASALLCMDNRGGWGLLVGDSFRSLSLLRVWRGMGWLTLRFSDAAAIPPGHANMELTIWKGCVSPLAWRRLCILTARDEVSASRLARAAPRSMT